MKKKIFYVKSLHIMGIIFNLILGDLYVQLSSSNLMRIFVLEVKIISKKK